MRRLLQSAAAFAGIAVLTSCVSPANEAAQAEEMVALGQGLTTLQGYIGDLEMRIDSLVGVIASQDTAITRIAEFTGLVLPGRERR